MTTSVFLVVHEISDDYHPIAGPPGNFFRNFALRQITLVFWSSTTNRCTILARFPSSKLCMRGGGGDRSLQLLFFGCTSDDYHPIAGPPGEIFEISLYVKSRLRFGALRRNTLAFWTGIFEVTQGSGAAKSEPVGRRRREEEEREARRSKI